MTTVIELESVTKHYGRTVALDDFSLRVEQGQVHGFLGPNGAGKTTTMRILLGLLRISSGRVTVFGLDPWRDVPAIHSRLSYVPGDVTLWPNLTGGETLDILTRLQGGAGIVVPGSTSSNSTRRRRTAPIPRATGRRWRWSRPSPPTPSC